MKRIKAYFLIITVIALSILSKPVNTQATINTNATAPSITGSEIWEFDLSDEPDTINWTMVDDNPKSYEISLENTVVGFGDWEQLPNATVESYLISYDVFLDPGTYVFTLTVTDYDDLSTTHSSTVLIKEPNVPNSFVGMDLAEYLIISFMAIFPVIMIKKKWKR